MTDKVVVLSTCSSSDEARRVARSLVEKHLAACVQVSGAVASIYRWQGKIEEAAEYWVLIKTSRALLDAVRLELEKLHSYEVPEMVALPIVDGSPNYLNWLDAELKTGSDGAE
jgi:periplasmic divalent cation tolerance protein